MGLFKSRSFSELHDLSASVKAEFKLPPRSPREKSVSQDDLNISGIDVLPPSPRCVPPSKGLVTPSESDLFCIFAQMGTEPN